MKPGFLSGMRNVKLIIALTAVAASLFVSGCGGGGDESVPTDAVAVVDGTEITRTEFDRVLDQAKRGYVAQKRPFPKPGSPEYEDLKNKAIAYLVQRVEYRKEADELGIEVSDKKVDDRLSQIKAQYFGNDPKRYKAQLKSAGLTEEQVRQDIRTEILEEEVFKKVTADVTVTDAQIRKYYREHQSQYAKPEQRAIAHILVKKKPLADDLYDRIQNGENFAALAKRYSQDPGSKNQGGKLTISKGQTVAPFDQTAFLMRTGQVSRPVKTEFGYHIIKALADAIPAKTEPLDKKLTEQIREQLLTEKRNEKMTKWVEDIRKEHADDVRYQVGFAPPATTTTATTSE
jgi:parvulin-like peptidyl-prolyl isomerase